MKSSCDVIVGQSHMPGVCAQTEVTVKQQFVRSDERSEGIRSMPARLLKAVAGQCLVKKQLHWLWEGSLLFFLVITLLKKL